MLLSLLLGIACNTTPKWDDSTLKKLAKDPDLLAKTLKEHPLETQDLLLLTLAIRNPNEANRFCKRIQTDNAKEKCRQVIGRPHLQLSKPQQNDVIENSK